MSQIRHPMGLDSIPSSQIRVSRVVYRHFKVKRVRWTTMLVNCRSYRNQDLLTKVDWYILRLEMRMDLKVHSMILISRWRMAKVLYLKMNSLISKIKMEINLAIYKNIHNKLIKVDNLFQIYSKTPNIIPWKVQTILVIQWQSLQLQINPYRRYSRIILMYLGLSSNWKIHFQKRRRGALLIKKSSRNLECIGTFIIGSSSNCSKIYSRKTTKPSRNVNLKCLL